MQQYHSSLKAKRRWHDSINYISLEKVGGGAFASRESKWTGTAETSVSTADPDGR